MPRSSRKISNTGYYHIMTRGVNKQWIFNDEIDRAKYLNCIKMALKNYKIKIICFCLMPNHTHLVVYDVAEQLSRFMQSLNTSYASYYNKKYERIGPLFQDRFKSECIKCERQLLAAYRYVLNNPSKAKMCQPWDYKWNSYSSYNKESDIVDTTTIAGILGSNENHRDFVSSYSEEHFIDID